METDSLKFKGDIFSKGFGTVPKAPLKDVSLTMESKALYAYLCSYAGAGVTAYPSVSLMASDFGVTTERIEKHKRLLIEKGYISVTKIREKGKFARNVYTIESDLNPPKKENVYHQKPSVAKPSAVKPITDKPFTDKPFTDKPFTDKQGTISNSLINNSSIINSNINNKENKDIVEQAQPFPFSEIIEFLNSTTGKKFRASSKAAQRSIRARFKEGYTLDDFKHVITVKSEQWLDDNVMDKYLKPETLFSPKFEGYVNEKMKGAKHNAQTITRDFTEIRDTDLF